MALTQDQAESIKKQLIQNVEKSFPKEKQEFAKEQINSMDSGQLEEFLEKNNLKYEQGKLAPISSPGQPNCIFCSIVSGDSSSYKIDENKDSMAVLEINPLSKGHTIIIPKQHISEVDQVPESVFSLAKKISKRMKSKLEAKKIEISSSNMFGHEIINIIPVYGEDVPSERNQAGPEELGNLMKVLKAEKKPVQKDNKPKKIDAESKNLWLPKRIP